MTSDVSRLGQVKSLWDVRQAALDERKPTCDELDKRREEFYRGVDTALRDLTLRSFGPFPIGSDTRAQRDQRLASALTSILQIIHCGVGQAAEASHGARRLLALVDECGLEPRWRRAALDLWARRHAQLWAQPSRRPSFEELALREEEFHQGLDATVRYLVFEIGKSTDGVDRGAARIRQMALECKAFLQHGYSPGSGSTH